jgi:hypothetical protein
MKRTICSICPLAVTLLLGQSAAYAQTPVGTDFTYQGQLIESGSPANGDYDFVFQLFDAAVSPGPQVGGDVTVDDWPVANGLFMVTLDFGAGIFAGDQRWLEVAVRPGASTGPYTTFDQRQMMTGTPYALYALDGPDSGHWTLTGSGDIYNNNSGRVGVGTSDPQYNLHVYHQGTSGGGNFPPAKLGLEFFRPGLPGFPALNDWFSIEVGGSGLPPWGAGTRLIREAGTRLTFQTEETMNSGLRATQMTLDGNGRLGIGTSSPQYPLHVETTDRIYAIYVHNSMTDGYGVYGEANGPRGTGVYGYALDASGFNRGVWGRSLGRNGVGVQGLVQAGSGVNYGVHGSSDSTSGYDFFAAGAGQDYGSSSSIRWKSNVRNIDRPLEKISRLRGVYYDWDAEHGGHHDVGMIAEEVGAVLPEIVTYEENGIDAHGMDYSKLTPLLVEAVNALRAENDTLRARLDSLERRLTPLTEQAAAAGGER